LVSIVSGSALVPYHALSEAELVKSAQQSLQEIFKEVEVPEPSQVHITRWGKEQYSQMSLEFLKFYKIR